MVRFDIQSRVVLRQSLYIGKVLVGQMRIQLAQHLPGRRRADFTRDNAR